MSDSYKPKFDTGDLVVTPGGNIGIVEPSSQYRVLIGDTIAVEMHYRIKCWVKGKQMIENVYSEVLRSPTFREFMWFRNPNTGGWMFGKTRGWMAILIHLCGGFVYCAGFTVEELGARWVTHFIGLMVIGIMWLGTYFNYTKKWV